MNKVISISINDTLFKTIKTNHSNVSKYFEELAKADLYKSKEQTFKQALLNDEAFINILTDKIISNFNNISSQHVAMPSTAPVEPIIVPDYQ